MPNLLSFAAPGRVNLIGEHTDYAEGFVMPVAINFATLAAISPRANGKIVFYAENYREEAVFDRRVDRQSQLQVGIDSVATLLLEAVRPKLVREAYSSAFVPSQVHDYS